VVDIVQADEIVPLMSVQDLRERMIAGRLKGNWLAKGAG
jgi:hypothetical protein